jgi:hypothetical protein
MSPPKDPSTFPVGHPERTKYEIELAQKEKKAASQVSKPLVDLAYARKMKELQEENKEKPWINPTKVSRAKEGAGRGRGKTNSDAWMAVGTVRPTEYLTAKSAEKKLMKG